MTQNNTAEHTLKQRRNQLFMLLGSLVAVSAIAVTTYWALYASHFVSTDNAYTAVEVAQITPAVSGTVQQVLVKDTQVVKAGDILVMIDQTDIKLAMAQANAQLAAAQADFERARTDLERRAPLVSSGAVSGEEFTRVKSTQATTEAALTVARARLEQTKVDLERTTIKSSVDGVVAKRQVQQGQRVQTGMPLMVVVPVGDMYVDANFKEVQLEKVRVGQPVKLHADLYGKGVTYTGVVEGFSGGSGSAFSVIPAQNATGNWIKVVQRLPVRVKLDPAQLQTNPLKVGLSMSAEIDTRQSKN